MRGCVAPTDFDWYECLRRERDLTEVNFWLPSGGRTFRALEPGDPFLFKLKAAHGHKVVGFGFFARFSVLPAWLAWDCFGAANGAASWAELRGRLEAIRDRNSIAADPDLEIGCILLSRPVLFPLEDAVAGPRDWRPRTQSYCTYDLGEGEGMRLWRDCLERAKPLWDAAAPPERPRPPALEGYRLTTGRARLGQGTFHAAVLDAYGRRCAVTEEHSLPVLEAAHIVPYSVLPEHDVRNGLLLRSDVHQLFDRGFCTVDESNRFVVSDQLRTRWKNGRTYYDLQGRRLLLPSSRKDRPDPEALRWHRDHVFAGA